MNELEKEMAIRRIVEADKERLRTQRRDHILFTVCASCLTLTAILPAGPYLIPLFLTALGTWLVFVDALDLPKSWGEDSDVRWHLFRPSNIVENGFRKEKGWRTLILIVGFAFLMIVVKLK